PVAILQAPGLRNGGRDRPELAAQAAGDGDQALDLLAQRDLVPWVALRPDAWQAVLSQGADQHVQDVRAPGLALAVDRRSELRAPRVRLLAHVGDQPKVERFDGAGLDAEGPLADGHAVVAHRALGGRAAHVVLGA